MIHGFTELLDKGSNQDLNEGLLIQMYMYFQPTTLQ